MHYSVLEADSANKRVLLDTDLSVNGVLWASEESQVCLVDQMSARQTDEPAIGMLDAPFRVVDMRSGGEGKPDINTLFNTEESVAVVGGSPKASDQINSLPFKYQRKIITVNHHYPQGDYHVFADRICAEMITGKGKRVSYWGDLSDYAMDARVTGTWFHRNSTFMALWLACCMAKRVTLVGFDLPPDRACPTLEHHLDLWRKAISYLPPGRKIRAMKDSPLSQIFETVD